MDAVETNNLPAKPQSRLKRLVDVFGAAIMLVCFSPLMLCIAALVRWNLGSPVFFVQKRTGLHGRLFGMIKFRSMREAVDAAGNPLPDDQRMTRFGSFLRKSSLDELPELINVLRGEMSLVGPRPLLPQYLPLYTPEQNRRHSVRPGLTGWAQVNGRNSLAWDQKFRLDVWYVDHPSLWLDIDILLRTVGKVLIPSGVSQSGHATMTAFDAAASSRVVVIGAGGHAKVVIDSLRRLGYFVEAVYDDDSACHGSSVLGVPVVGSLTEFEQAPARKAMIAIGSATAREKISARFDNAMWLTVVDPRAHVANSVQLGDGTYVAAGAVIQPDAEIGNHVIVNTSSSVDHDCCIGNFAHVAPNSVLAGSVKVGASTLIGAGSSVIPGVEIGNECRVGSGAVVLADIPDQSTAVGVPAKVRTVIDDATVRHAA